MSGAQRESLAQRLLAEYTAGASIREVAARTGCSYGFVRQLLREAGAPMRGRAGGAVTGVERENLAQLLGVEYAQGASIPVLAKRIGRSSGFVHQLLREAGTALRAPIVVAVTGVEREKLAQLLVTEYAQGTSMNALAKRIGRSKGLVHTLLREAGAPPRRRGRPTPARGTAEGE